MTDAELVAAGERPVVGYTTYHVYTIFYRSEGHREVRIESPEDLVPFAQTVLKSLEETWIPWMVETSERQGDSVEGIYRQTHRIHADVTFVP